MSNLTFTPFVAEFFMWFRRESIAKQALVHFQCDAKLIKKLHLLRIDIGNLGSFVSAFNEKKSSSEC